MRILTVDDDPMITRLLRDELLRPVHRSIQHATVDQQVALDIDRFAPLIRELFRDVRVFVRQVELRPDLADRVQ